MSNDHTTRADLRNLIASLKQVAKDVRAKIPTGEPLKGAYYAGYADAVEDFAQRLREADENEPE